METNLTSPIVIDLFSGVGGFSLGAENAGFHVAAAIDNDPLANEYHIKNFPNTITLKEDITTLTGANILNLSNTSINNLDGVIGGPPCQGFSTMGHKRHNDERNNLFRDFFRLVNELNPKFYIAENVPGILDHKYTTTRIEALSQLGDDFYSLDPLVLKASSFGAPTSRTRVFFIGFNKKYFSKEVIQIFLYYLDLNKKIALTVEEALEGLPLEINPDWQSEQENWHVVEKISDEFRESIYHTKVPQGVGDPESCSRLQNFNLVSGFLGTVHTQKVIDRFSFLKPGEIDKVSRAKKLRKDGICPTIRAGTDNTHGSFQAIRPIHYSENRVITIREAARLQGFPDWFLFHPTKWHAFRQIGNSVCPIQAENVLKAILTSCY